MFQFAGFASPSYGFTRRYGRSRGFPHSEIPGSTGARPLPGLIAACHVLHRLSVPRHSPNALLIKLHHIQPQTCTARSVDLPDSCRTGLSLERVLTESRPIDRASQATNAAGNLMQALCTGADVRVRQCFAYPCSSDTDDDLPRRREHHSVPASRSRFTSRCQWTHQDKKALRRPQT